jgi:hypothetical protein
LIWTNAPSVDASDETNLTEWGRYAIAQDLAPGATILADRDKHPPLDYFARVEGLRPDLDVVILGDEKAYLDRLVWDQAHQKTVYLARFLPGLDGPFYLRSLGPLVEVATEPLVPTSHSSPLATFGGQIELLDYELTARRGLQAGDQAYLTLYWRAPVPVSANYQISLRLQSSRGQVWWQYSSYPVSGMYPAVSWKPSEVVRDWHDIPIAETMPPGTYTLQVGLHPPFSDLGIPYTDSETWLSLGDIQVEPNQALNPPHRLRAIAPGQWQIVGYDLAAQAAPGSRVMLELYWQALAPLKELEVGTRMVIDDAATQWRWERPARGDYPSTEWPRDRTIATQHTLEMPTEQSNVVVQIGVRPAGRDGDTEDTRQELYPHWLATHTTALSLPPVKITGSPPTAADAFNYGDSILLQNVTLRNPTLIPGGALELNVRWSCLRDMDKDYTLFVQLIAPDGTLKGQIDVWPRDGTSPTSAWRVGQTIEDAYLVPLEPDAPTGDYQVAMGWYLLETMRRLPVLDDQGRAIDDRVLIPGVAVTSSP